jgi:hypothetical protein
MPRRKPHRGSQAIQANERRGTLLHVLTQKRMWMDVSALRRFVDAKRQIVEQDLDRMAASGEIEVASLMIYNPGLDRCQIVKMARKV